jgi:hypothetical protein
MHETVLTSSRLLPSGLPEQQEVTLAPLIATIQSIRITTIIALHETESTEEAESRPHRRPANGARSRS